MNGLLGKFSLENSEEFFNNYKVNNTLAQEASTALDQFILSLNEFFDLCEDLSEEMLMGNTEVSWYSYANVESSGDYIRAKSMYYNEPSTRRMKKSPKIGNLFWHEKQCIFTNQLTYFCLFLPICESVANLHESTLLFAPNIHAYFCLFFVI